MTATQGIDICPSIQSRVNWHAVAGAGIQFAYVQATNGRAGRQSGFDAAYHGAKSELIRVGAYHFFRADVDPIAQIEWFLGHTGSIAADDMPPMLDVESSEGVRPSVIIDSLIRAIEHLETLTRRRPILYTYPGFWASLGDFGKTSLFGAYPLWIAHYGVAAPIVPAPWRDWTIWQYSGNGGHVPGVGTDCDRNVCARDLDSVIFDSRIANDTDRPAEWHPAEAIDVLPTIFAEVDDSPTAPGTPTSKSSQSLKAVKG